MTKKINIMCPAKINLDLRVYKKDKKNDYHAIKSIMQAISLFDYLEISISEEKLRIDDIRLFGESEEIPYDETNLCYKAAKAFLRRISQNEFIDIYIRKNIPVAAGLGGGSSDAAGVLVGLNKLFNEPLATVDLIDIASQLGSDIAFCLEGGTKLCTGKGDNITPMPFYDFKLSLIKPEKLKISAKEAYDAFDRLNIESNMRNDLEFALLQEGKYPEITYLSSLGFQMSGSGPTFFLRDKNVDIKLKEGFRVYNDLNSVCHGVMEV